MVILPTTVADVQRIIFEYLPPKDLLRCRLVSQLWKTLAEQIPRRPGGMLSIADQFRLRSLRQTLITGPQKEETIAEGVGPPKEEDPTNYLLQAGFQIRHRHAPSSVKLYVQNATTQEHLGIIDISNQPPSSLAEENYLLSRLSPDELAEKYAACYACQNNELITLFKDGTVFYWKMIEGQFIRTKVLRLPGIDDFFLSANARQWKHFLLVNALRHEDGERGRTWQLHVYDLSNHCQRPSLSPLDQPIDFSLTDKCHKADSSRLVIWTQSLHLPNSKSPTKVHYFTLDEHNSLHLKTVDLEPILTMPTFVDGRSFSTTCLTFTNHGFILKLGNFLYVLNRTRNAAWLLELDVDLMQTISFARIEALHEGDLLILRNFWNYDRLGSIGGLRRCQIEKGLWLIKTTVAHLPSGELLPVGKIDELAGPPYIKYVIPEFSGNLYPFLKKLQFSADGKSMQVEVANLTETKRLEYTLDCIPKFNKRKSSSK